MTTRATRGPGLAKTRGAPLFVERPRAMLATSDARWRELVEAAEVLSEGGPFGEGAERAYFGSSSLLLPEVSDEAVDPSQLLRVAAGDPHLRVRAIRCARREAALRAGGPLERVRAEVSFAARRGALLVRVDVEARVLPERRARSRDPLLTHGVRHAKP